MATAGKAGQKTGTGGSAKPGSRREGLIGDDREKHIAGLVQDLGHRNEDVRWGAAYALARIGGPAVPALIAAMQDRDSVVRLRAAWALGRIGDPGAIDGLVLLLRDGDWSVRMRAAEALGRLRAKSAVDPLVHALRDENIDVRRHAIAALGQTADPASADRLGAALKDPDWRVRMGAALALTAIGDEKSRGFLASAQGDENEFVRKIAISAAGETGPVPEVTAREVRALSAADLPANTMKGVTVEGREILLSNAGGTISAIGNTCTHHGCKLSKGKLDGETVTCPCHGSVFHVRTGAVARGPAKQPEPVYGIVIRDGEIRILV